MATLVNCRCKSFIKLTPGLNCSSDGQLYPTDKSISSIWTNICVYIHFYCFWGSFIHCFMKPLTGLVAYDAFIPQCKWNQIICIISEVVYKFREDFEKRL